MSHKLVRYVGWRAMLWYGDPLVRDRWEWLKKRVGKTTGYTLDAGCGDGTFSVYLGAKGNRVHGISFQEKEVQAGRLAARLAGARDVVFTRGDLRGLDRLGLEPQSFDRIVCFEVIEHVFDDGGLLRSLTALLKPGGQLLLTTPWIDHPPLLGECLSEEEDGGHVRWGYSEAQLRGLLEPLGFEIRNCERIGGRASQHLTNLCRRGRRRGVRWVTYLAQAIRLLCFADAALTRRLGQPFHIIAVDAHLPSMGGSKGEQ